MENESVKELEEVDSSNKLREESHYVENKESTEEITARPPPIALSSTNHLQLSDSEDDCFMVTSVNEENKKPSMELYQKLTSIKKGADVEEVQNVPEASEAVRAAIAAAQLAAENMIQNEPEKRSKKKSSKKSSKKKKKKKQKQHESSWLRWVLEKYVSYYRTDRFPRRTEKSMFTEEKKQIRKCYKRNTFIKIMYFRTMLLPHCILQIIHTLSNMRIQK